MEKNSKTKSNDTEGIAPGIYARRWQILITLCVSLLLVSLGNSSLNLALPTLARDLQLTSLQLTWIVDIYALVFASLLFTASTVADRYGRKLVMQVGLGIFLAATLYASFGADTGSEMVVARAVMGLGAAMVMPTTLSIIENVFPRKERARAIAIWGGVAGGGVALGSVLSGFLLEYYSWHSVFIFSASVGVVGFIFNQFLTPESLDEKQTPIDWLGGVLSTIGLFGIVYGIIEAPTHGITDTLVWGSLMIGLLAIGVFAWRQTKIKHPMLDMRLFREPAFSISALSITLTFFALMGIFFSMSQLFQLIMGYSALESSLRLLPLMILMMVVSPFVPNIVKKIGARWTVTAGLALVSLSFVIMAQWPVIPEYYHVAIGMMIMMTGMSLTMAPATNMLMSAIPRNRAGMGSAMNDTTRELGGALGIAVLGAILSSGYSKQIAGSLASLPAQAQDIASSSLAGALAIAENAGPLGVGLAEAAKTAWMNSLMDATWVAAGIVAVAAVIAAVWLPHRHGAGEDDEVLDPVIEP